MPQFLLKPEALVEKPRPEGLKGARFKLTGPDAFHIAKVLRQRPGEALQLFDGHGGHFHGTISKVSADEVEGVIVDAVQAAPRARVSLRLYPGLLKAAAWEWVLEKCTEMGASSFTPVITPRTVVLFEREHTEAKRERWAKIIMAATKQCGRADLPVVKAPMHFPDAIREAAARGVTLLAWEGMTGAAAHESLGEALKDVAIEAGKEVEVSLFLGPEGGFSDEEVELAEAVGAVPFGLGENTLRAETAALAAATAVLYELGAL